MPLTHVDEPDRSGPGGDGGGDLGLTWRVDVPPERVWACLTEPNLLRLWLGEVVSGAVAPGSELVVDHGDGYLCRSRVVAHVEASALELTWQFPDEPATRLALALSDDGSTRGATELRLRHSGLGDLVGSYRAGWCTHLTFLEAAAAGTPLPTSMFWNLHGTIAHLADR